MTYTEKPHTNILKGSLSDAKLKYFSTKDYFKKQKKINNYYLTINSLATCFNL